TPISKLERGKPPSLTEKQEVRHKALQDLKRLLELKTEQIKKYGRVLLTSSCFYRRHLMVMSFFWIQERRKEFPNIDRRGLAKIVASTNRKGHIQARKSSSGRGHGSRTVLSQTPKLANIIIAFPGWMMKGF